MTLLFITLLGLCLGSFTNALVWRVHEQAQKRKISKSDKRRLSIAHGRSMCPHCRHELSARDLVPVLSWLLLRGKCRYCGSAISQQYPLVELAVALLFILSYIFWPYAFDAEQWLQFGLWLILLVGFAALAVYDLRWMLLPDRIIFPLMGVALIRWLVWIIGTGFSWQHLTALLTSVAVGGGIFYILFQLSGGRWIGGGDVKLGALLGLALADPMQSALMLFMAAMLGSAVSLPLLALKRVDRQSKLPFGPFLLSAAIIVALAGQRMLIWYEDTFLLALV